MSAKVHEDENGRYVAVCRSCAWAAYPSNTYVNAGFEAAEHNHKHHAGAQIDGEPHG